MSRVSAPHTFDDILADIRDEAEKANQKKAGSGKKILGTRFEKITLDFLRTDRHYKNQFTKVETWRSWATTHNNDPKDDGIDLVATQNDGSFCGIQCKCYADDGNIDHKALGTFNTACSTYRMKRRILVYTGEHITDKAEFHLKKNNGFMITQELMRSARVDWSKFPILVAKKPYELRDYQKIAYDDVVSKFRKYPRGQLLMACGTGKTLTSLRIAEKITPKAGIVLYLVPSITLIQQSMREWSEQRKRKHNYIAVCSDKSVGSEDGTKVELESPVSTKADELRQYLHDRPKNRMTVIFCTYNSVKKASEALGKQHIDVAFCDEAHRTIGGADQSFFTFIHDDKNIKVKKRLYMTATPKIFTDKIRKAADAQEKTIYAMDDEKAYGPVFHHLTFDDAVHKYKALSDYKVMIMHIDPKDMSETLQASMTDDEGLMTITYMNRLLATWKGLMKPDGHDEPERLLQRVIVFSNTIKASKKLAGESKSPVQEAKQGAFKTVVDKLNAIKPSEMSASLRHVDGESSSLERKRHLRWLGDSNNRPSECRLLSNARCLSEGVDVPALDAVAFMEPRRSMVDVVQSVGRVMRKHASKELGYVILPVAIPSGEDVNETLNAGDTWKTVWEVLNALRSHDPKLEYQINQLILGKKIKLDGKVGPKIEIIRITDKPIETGDTERVEKLFYDIGTKLIEKVGDRGYYDRYGKKIGKIAMSIEHQMLERAEKDPQIKAAFGKLHDDLKIIINDSVTIEATIQTTVQHMIMSRIFKMLFQGDFVSHHPVPEALDKMIKEVRLDSELKELESFYAEAEEELGNITTRIERQSFIKKIYENFFKAADKKGAEKHGIVYTPIEVADFIIHSTEYLLKRHFGLGFNDRKVKVLEPFVGTGTFMVRLLESMLITDNIYKKYRHDIHASEIVLLAYYVASVNIETTYSSLKKNGKYVPFEGINYTDTFMQESSYVRKDEYGKMKSAQQTIQGDLKKAHERLLAQKYVHVHVIIGNPPYSANQGKFDNNNPNTKYEHIDERIKDTYAKKTNVHNKNSLYDSYIRALRWASDRLGTSGIVAYVTNASFIRSGVGAGIRASLATEFDEIWCLDLRGNARTQGEVRRKEGDNVFDMGSRAPVAVTLLVKSPQKHKIGSKQATIHYKDIGDYLSRDEKLETIKKHKSIKNILDWKTIHPDKHHDWIEKRNDSFTKYLPMGSNDAKAGITNAVFKLYSNGLKSHRDVWVYNSSKETVSKNMQSHIEYCNTQNLSNPKVDPRKAQWSADLTQKLKQSKPQFQKTNIRHALYRPFFKQYLYFDKTYNGASYHIPSIFPKGDTENLVICVPYKFIGTFSVLITDLTPDLHIIKANQCFPLYVYNGNSRSDNITNTTLNEYRCHYKNNYISKSDIFYYVYGLLHHGKYLTTFYNNLSKDLPHIPMAPNFAQFKKVGKMLADLHLNFEKCKRHNLGKPLNKIENPEIISLERDDSGKKTRVKINGLLMFKDIPQSKYKVNGRTPLECIDDRYKMTEDKRSLIVNHPLEGMDEEDAIALIERAVHVGLESDRLIAMLPEEFEPNDWKPPKAGLDAHMTT